VVRDDTEKKNSLSNRRCITMTYELRTKQSRI